ncbi:phage baseplate assembly protein V [Chloroherpeton thalassium ATCC 35110]|uniref:Phage baseplate assembly protein V n=1 Tax=Chloroherpeton thalassium (strain ATCC 35110 / GB-78) TaxID=517418 RepID=B3QTI6_CHLT3|nr:phage baseplate assembly protein V [Chloroherpeton thalassium]ACF12732.1 phage baseplate assembly protein V [Chloroherpeton thalassium ATCC 35110]
MLKFAKITEIDEQKALARVMFPELNLTSGWYFVLQRKTKMEKYYVMPDIGEHVVCLCSDDLAWGVVLGAIYNDLNTIPADAKSGVEMKVFSDGTTVKYDTAGSELEINLNTSGKVKLIGNVEIVGNVSIDGEMSATKDISTEKNLEAGEDVSDGNGSMNEMRETYNTHTHPVVGSLGAGTAQMTTQKM